MRILEIFFPSSDDELLLQSLTQADFAYKYQNTSLDGILALASFKDKAVRAALHLNKFHQSAQARILLSVLLTKYLKNVPKRNYLLIPIPLSKKRLRSRGHNQVATIAEDALKATELSILLSTSILKRNRNTIPQTSLSRTKRLQNLKGAFVVRASEAESIKDAHIILLDDVTTSGATLTEAKKVLLQYDPASITCIAIAR